MWELAPSGLGASNIGIRGAESIGGDWKFIFQLEAGFDPYSLQLSNSAQSVFDNKGVPLNQQIRQYRFQPRRAILQFGRLRRRKLADLRHPDLLPPKLADSGRLRGV